MMRPYEALHPRNGSTLMITLRNNAADDGADEPAAATEQAGATEHGGGDAGEGVARPDGWVADLHLGGEEAGHRAPRRRRR